MLMRTPHGDWRLTPPMHKLVLMAHIVASVGWLGIAVSKLALAVAASRTVDPGISQALLVAIGVIDRAFPPAAILTFVTGIVLGLVTKWGIVQYTWVLVKLALTIAVPVTAVRLGERFLVEAQNGTTPRLVIWLVAIHIVMLGAATALSIYKPWGKTWFGRRRDLTPSRCAARISTASTSSPARRGEKPMSTRFLRT